MSDWLNTLGDCGPCVLITVAATRGSTPRETGTKMIVTANRTIGTIGGGHLEYKAIAIGRELLADDSAEPELRRFPLGPSLGQCCGGVAELLFEPLAAEKPAWIEQLIGLRKQHQAAVLVTPVEGTSAAKRIVTADARPTDAVSAYAGALLRSSGEANVNAIDGQTLLFEPLRPSDFHIVLFGAGHVGKALIHVLSTLPCTVTWVDSRDDEFPAAIPANVNAEISDAPEYEVDCAPPGSYFLIMTHSHPLDQAICERALQRGDFRYCGLIGSDSKKRKFEKRLRARGLPLEAWNRLTCPIGVDGISGKLPAEIAIAVAAELLQVRERASRRDENNCTQVA